MLPQLRGQDELSGFLKTSYASKKFVSLKLGSDSATGTKNTNPKNTPEFAFFSKCGFELN